MTTNLTRQQCVTVHNCQGHRFQITYYMSTEMVNSIHNRNTKLGISEYWLYSCSRSKHA